MTQATHQRSSPYDDNVYCMIHGWIPRDDVRVGRTGRYFCPYCWRQVREKPRKKQNMSEITTRKKRLAKSNMKLTTLWLWTKQIEGLDKLVKQKLYPNRAEAIRFFIKDGLDYHRNVGEGRSKP